MEYSNNFKKVLKVAKESSNGIIEPVHLLWGVLTIKSCTGYNFLSHIIDIKDAEKIN